MHTWILLLLCAEAHVDPDRVAAGTLTDREFREVAEAAARLSYMMGEN